MTLQASSGRVSVIIPAHNAEKYIHEAITSVLSQSYADTECIVVDDGSTDSTAAMAKGNGEVIYIYQNNAERSVARNKGIDAATGEYVAFLDADDFIAPNKLKDQVAFLEAHREYDAVYSRVRFFRENGERTFFNVDRQTPDGDLLRQLLYGNVITVHAPLIRKSAVVAIAGFDPRLSHNEDWEFFLRLALAGTRFGFLDDYHAFCRVHDANTSRDEVRMHESKWQVARRFVSEHLEELREKGIVAEPALAFHEADFGKALIANGRADKGRRHILNACRQPFPGRKKYLLFALLSAIFSTKICSRFAGGAYRGDRDDT